VYSLASGSQCFSQGQLFFPLTSRRHFPPDQNPCLDGEIPFLLPPEDLFSHCVAGTPFSSYSPYLYDEEPPSLNDVPATLRILWDSTRRDSSCRDLVAAPSPPSFGIEACARNRPIFAVRVMRLVSGFGLVCSHPPDAVFLACVSPVCPDWTRLTISVLPFFASFFFF